MAPVVKEQARYGVLDIYHHANNRRWCMAPSDEVNDAVTDLKHAVKQQVKAARARSERSGEGSHTLNAAERNNIVVASNVREEGSVRGASAKQTTRIRQRDGQTHEETNVTNSIIEGGA
jgi:hypothetical protein